MTIYVLVRKTTETYDSLFRADTDVNFIFEEVETFPATVSHYQRKLEEALKFAGSHDRVVFNGPAWLIAIAGGMWYQDDRRIHHNILQFCKFAHAYKLIEGEIDDF